MGVKIETTRPQGLKHGSSYSIPKEARKLYNEGILQNPLIAEDLPPEALVFAESVNFVGSDHPTLPINWRFAESVSSLKALEASLISALLKRKYDTNISSVTINTDHAQLFFMSTLLNSVNPSSPDIAENIGAVSERDKYIKNYDFHNMNSSLHRESAINIYKTRDGRYFHLHGSMNPDSTLDSIGLSHDSSATTWEEAWEPFFEKLSEIESSEMQRLASDIYKQAGVICESVESFRASEHGKANAHVGLFEIYHVDNSAQAAGWWESSPQTSPSRPLAGLKVVDLTRVIAAPAITRGLAELGASVMRLVASRSKLGKWNCSLDLRTEEGKEKLKALVLEADVVVQAYRPGVLDKYGFGQQAIIDLCNSRPRGIISVRENCYGWHGPWSYRTGWQQISDACVGISWGFGKAMGLQDGEAVTPVFPNSDYMTGIAGVSAVLCALLKRAEQGGSYKIDMALNYYNQWLANTAGEYPIDVWQEVWERNGREVFRSHHNMVYMIPRYLEMIKTNSANELLRPEFFEDRVCGAMGGVTVRSIKPVIKFDKEEVVLKYTVGTRGNSVDEPHWPHDLMVEFVR